MSFTVRISFGRPHFRTALRGLARLLLFAALASGPSSASTDQLEFDTPGPVPLLALDHGRDAVRTVVIRDGQLTPARVEVHESTRIAWRSETSGGMRILFDRDVARSMLCTSVVNFVLEDDRLQSARLEHGDTAHFCTLAPGTYRYKVARDRLSDRRGALSERLRGTIVVHAGGVAAP
ncbi:MAG: hypothetical protein ACQGVK_03235 [Myxococcota bacterium]